METVDLLAIEEFQPASIVKKIPIMTDRLMAALICIDKNKKTLPHKPTEFDEFHYVIKGSGKITVGGERRDLFEGMLVFVPNSESYSFSTTQDQLVIMTISPIPEYEVDLKQGGIA